MCEIEITNGRKVGHKDTWVVYKYQISMFFFFVGAGFSGINMTIRLKEIGVKYKIFEKSKRLGGTWWDNQYPGCACDIASHMYRYISA